MPETPRTDDMRDDRTPFEEFQKTLKGLLSVSKKELYDALEKERSEESKERSEKSKDKD